MNSSSRNNKIFLIHGWTYTTASWDACIAELRARGVEPIMLNVPGLSEASEKVWTLEGYADWLKEKLVAAGVTPENPAIIAGHSNGGRIAIEYIKKHGNANLSKLILEDSAGIVHNELPLRIKRAVFSTVAKIGKTIVGREGVVRKVFYRVIGGGDYGRAPENMRETMAGLVSIDLQDALPSIKVPTLIIWGGKDTATPVSDARIMKQKIAGSELAIIEEAGHSPHLSHPVEVADLIAGFIF